MSHTEAPSIVAGQPVPIQPKMISLSEAAALLVKHFGYHEGIYDLALSLQVSIGQIAQSSDGARIPGAAIGVSEIGLAKVSERGPNTVDAAKVNPAITVPKGQKTARKAGKATQPP